MDIITAESITSEINIDRFFSLVLPGRDLLSINAP